MAYHNYGRVYFPVDKNRTADENLARKSGCKAGVVSEILTRGAQGTMS